MNNFLKTNARSNRPPQLFSSDSSAVINRLQLLKTRAQLSLNVAINNKRAYDRHLALTIVNKRAHDRHLVFVIVN